MSYDGIEPILPDLSWLHERFRLDTDAGRLYWIKPNKFHAEKVGAEAGSVVSSRGKAYWRVKIDGTIYKRSHIVYAMTHGRWPSPCVDHENGNSLDDRPCNLRAATVQENVWNRRSLRKKSPLPMGVRLTRGKYQARICKDGVSESVGMFDTPEKAAAAYQSARKERFNEFA